MALVMLEYSERTNPDPHRMGNATRRSETSFRLIPSRSDLVCHHENATSSTRLDVPPVGLGHRRDGDRSPAPAPIERPTVSHERPDRPCHLVRERHNRNVLLVVVRAALFSHGSRSRSTRLCVVNTVRAP